MVCAVKLYINMHVLPAGRAGPEEGSASTWLDCFPRRRAHALSCIFLQEGSPIDDVEKLAAHGYGTTALLRAATEESLLGAKLSPAKADYLLARIGASRAHLLFTTRTAMRNASSGHHGWVWDRVLVPTLSLTQEHQIP